MLQGMPPIFGGSSGLAGFWVYLKDIKIKALAIVEIVECQNTYSLDVHLTLS